MSIGWLWLEYLFANPDVSQLLWASGNFNLDVSFWNNVENAPNPLISLGHNSEEFSDEEMVGRMWMNKDDLEHMV